LIIFKQFGRQTGSNKQDFKGIKIFRETPPTFHTGFDWPGADDAQTNHV